MILENLTSLEDSICVGCEWNDRTFDENGAIDYCYKRDIYVDQMEGVKQCIYFKENELVYQNERKE